MNDLKHKIRRIATVICLSTLTIQGVWAQNLTVSALKEKNAIAIVQPNAASPILIDSADAAVVTLISRAVAADIEAITGKLPQVIHQPAASHDAIIIVGTIGASKWIDQLITSETIHTGEIDGQWESYLIQTVENPMPGVSKAIVIAGSDRRGTAYGLFELSRMMGVSPWIWWADVKPEKRATLYIAPGRKVFNSPSVKYRGIFLNDEDWGLKPWAAMNNDTDIQDIGPKTYAKVFELLLRLRGNFIWPAMHDCTKAFYFYPENPKVADQYAIVVGASHCEPMMRNNVDEWNVNFEKEYGVKPGDWRYDTNKDQIYKYWDDRLKTSHNYESVYTVGMRGIHDSGMPGPKDREGKVTLLEEVLTDQRTIFSNYFDDVTKVPQLFCPYKETLELYQTGLKLPDDVTIVWADDNHGYIRQLSNPDEQKRSGGSGVYYHISYWGAPHDYLWLSSISPALISYEMSKAWQFGADRLWIVNVGDIKPAEMETQFFLDLAWNTTLWTPENANNYAEYWAEQTFGSRFAKDIASIKNDYFLLSQNAKPEHLRMLHFNSKLKQERLTSYNQLVARVNKLKPTIPQPLQNAFFELIEYPVKGAALMNEKVFYAEMSLDAAEQNDQKALEYSAKATSAFAQIEELTRKYNQEIEGGKWNGIMSYNPRKLPVYGMPPVATAAMIGNSAAIVRDDLSKNKYLNNYEVESISTDEKPGMKSISASTFARKREVDGERIIAIDGLGLGGKSVSRYPLNGKSYPMDEIDNAPFIEYNIDLEPATYQVLVKCLPTQRIHDGRQVAYAISINNSKPQLVNVDVSKDNAAWTMAVLRGYSEGKSEHRLTYKTTSTVRIYLLDTNLALSKIGFVKKN